MAESAMPAHLDFLGGGDLTAGLRAEGSRQIWRRSGEALSGVVNTGRAGDIIDHMVLNLILNAVEGMSLVGDRP
jgi:hypothetical protein